MHTSSMLHAAILAGIPAALATPMAPGAINEPGNHYCFRKQQSEYKDIESSEPYHELPKLASGYQCTSNLEDTCTVTKSASHTEGVIETVSGSAGPTLNLGKILSLALNAGYSHSWTTSDTTGSSSSITCPAGRLHCGILVTTYLIKTTGKTRDTFEDQNGHTCKDADEWKDFEVIAPYLSAEDADEGQKVKMDFSTCVDKSQCGDDGCESDEAKVLLDCDVEAAVDHILHDPWVKND